MKQSGIYKITNLINGKFYVGSAVNLSNRKSRHFTELKRNIHPNNKLQNTFNKHGEENFKFEILEIIEDKTKLIEREQYYIDTLKPQLNISKTAGSTLGLQAWNKGISHKEETKQKIREKALGRKQSQETINKRVIKNKGKKRSDVQRNKLKHRTGDKNPFYNKHHTVEHKRRLSLLNGKEVQQLDLQNNIIAEFPSVRIAIKTTKITSLRAACRGITKTAGGFQWKFL